MKKTIFIITIILIVLIGRNIYLDNKTEKVLVSGKVFGFDIQNVKEIDTEYGKIVSTSLKQIGTITFIKQNNSFSALGHPVSKVNNGTIKGGCYEIDLEEIKKAKKDEPGQIVASLDESKLIGRLRRTNNNGVFGSIYDREEDLIEMETSSRYGISKGKAEIYFNIDGKGIQKYEVKITGINYISQRRNIKIKVKSSELIEKTGGIIQGMSGAPIVQNGKIVGAINGVSKDNPTEAYGIFIDKLI